MTKTINLLHSKIFVLYSSFVIFCSILFSKVITQYKLYTSRKIDLTTLITHVQQPHVLGKHISCAYGFIDFLALVWSLKGPPSLESVIADSFRHGFNFPLRITCTCKFTPLTLQKPASVLLFPRPSHASSEPLLFVSPRPPGTFDLYPHAHPTK